VGGHQQHLAQAELLARAARDRDVPEVRRVEGPAEDAEPAPGAGA
jgi:hypothetical protein